MSAVASVPQRSWLFTPGTKPDRFDRAAEAGADVLIIDLEDAVSATAKPQARANALALLAGDRPTSIAIALRINALRTPAGLADLALLAAPGQPDYLVLPKTEAADELRLVDALLAADLGATLAWEPLLHARSTVAQAATLSGVLAIDLPCFALRDAAALAAELAGSAALGFAAKAAIHPAQVGPINAALTPSPEAVEEARRILEENEKGVGVLAGRMIDEALARRARRTLAAAGVA